MRSPDTTGLAPGKPPRGCVLYAVAYVTVTGEISTVLRRTGSAAMRVAREVEDRGGTAVIYATVIGRADWRVPRLW